MGTHALIINYMKTILFFYLFNIRFGYGYSPVKDEWPKKFGEVYIYHIFDILHLSVLFDQLQIQEIFFSWKLTFSFFCCVLFISDLSYQVYQVEIGPLIFIPLKM